MTPCTAHRKMCTALGAAQLPPLCQDAADRAPASPCVADSSLPECKAYIYPAASAATDIGNLCGSMPDMSGCSVWNNCTVGARAAWPRRLEAPTPRVTRERHPAVCLLRASPPLWLQR